MNLCVIPARGGSRRIPRKNIKDFHGKPMIAYAIEAAKSSNLFNKIIVSTDDIEIAGISESYGAEIPFMRPDEQANDHASTTEAVAHAINECEKAGLTPKLVCCIYPCVPMIQIGDIQTALQLLESSSGAEYAFPIVEFPSAIQRCLRRDANGMISSFYSENQQTRTQELEPAYYDAGQFYWGYRDSWRQNARIHNSGVGLLIPGWRVVDIDTVEDWRRAEVLFTCLNEKEVG